MLNVPSQAKVSVSIEVHAGDALDLIVFGLE